MISCHLQSADSSRLIRILILTASDGIVCCEMIAMIKLPAELRCSLVFVNVHLRMCAKNVYLVGL